MADILTVLGVDVAGGELRLAAVVDTGAQMTVLPREAVDAATIHQRMAPVDVGGALGVASTREVVLVTLRLLQHGGRAHELPVIVGEVGEQPLVGMDLLEREGLVIDTESGTLKAKVGTEPTMPVGAESIPGGGYVLNAPKGYSRTVARLRFDAMRPRSAKDDASEGVARIPTRPSGYKVNQ